MQITVAEQGAFRFEPAFSAEEARGRAVAYKSKAFGTLAQLFSRPKDDEIALEVQGIRYDPLWHTKARVRFVYDCRETYRVSPKAPYVKSVTIGTDEYALETGKTSAIDVRVIEHCVRDDRKELWLDAVANKPVNAQPYAKAGVASVNLPSFAPEGAEITEPTVRASGAIRNLLGEDFRPVDDRQGARGDG